MRVLACPSDSLRYSCRAMLLAEVEYHAAWHAEQPGPDRLHERAAQVMNLVHAQLRTLSIDHPLFQRYATVWLGMQELEGHALGEAQRDLLRSYGMTLRSHASAEHFLRTLLDRLEAARGLLITPAPERPQ